MDHYVAASVQNKKVIEISVFHKYIYPILKMFRLLGINSFDLEKSGQIKTNVTLRLMVRVFITYLIIFISLYGCSSAFAKYSFQIYLTALINITIVLEPATFLLQSKEFIDFYRKFTIFQVNYSSVTRRHLTLANIPSTKLVPFVLPIWSGLSTVAIFIALSICDTRSFGCYQEMLHFFYYHLCQTLWAAYWLFTSKALRSIASQYKNAFRNDIIAHNNYSPTIEEYRLLWISLSDVARQLANSVCAHLPIFLIFVIIYLLLIIYNGVTVMSTIIHDREYFHLFIRAVDLMYMLALVFTYCNCAYKVTNECVDGMMEIILKLQSPILNDTVYQCKINLFLITVNEFSSTINLAGFFNINRMLFGSIVSVLATYLVIIIQLKSGVD